ncbi:hypothetical protein BpHYR1_018533 [Brachionus plicatilis]|uniref:Uncharacterized protein n=1 Tax=Brachionus plicatilis TaxID=10195 RepID=A0A3M7RSR2_BRAPC|nr:hypothetical protein BpHYR1_018533 [Brachionus plicatilis]
MLSPCRDGNYCMNQSYVSVYEAALLNVRIRVCSQNSSFIGQFENKNNIFLLNLDHKASKKLTQKLQASRIRLNNFLSITVKTIIFFFFKNLQRQWLENIDFNHNKTPIVIDYITIYFVCYTKNLTYFELLKKNCRLKIEALFNTVPAIVA